MTPYAVKKVFSDREILLLKKAEVMISLIPNREPFLDLRCYELARAVGRRLELPFVDGYFDETDHTWLWTRELTQLEHTRWEGGWYRDDRACILDVYVLCALPQVQLIDTWGSLPWRKNYRIGLARTDIKDDIIDALLARWKEHEDELEYIEAYG